LLAHPFLVILVGVLAGVLPGVFGFGGGWLLVPIVVLGLGVPWGFASGTVLCAILAGAGSGAVGQWISRRGEMRELDTPSEWTVTLTMVGAGLAGTVLGKAVLRDWLSGFRSAPVVLDVVLVVVLVGIVARLLHEVVSRRECGRALRPSRGRLAAVAAMTLVPGVLSGLIGIGGGILYVAILLFYLHWRADEARAASRLVVVGSALVGSGLYAWSGGVHFPTAVGMFVPAGIVGVACSAIRFSRTERRRRVFRLLAAVAAGIALALTAIDIFAPRPEAVAAAAGGAGAVALAVGAPVVWGALCGAVQGALTRRRRRRS